MPASSPATGSCPTAPPVPWLPGPQAWELPRRGVCSNHSLWGWGAPGASSSHVTQGAGGALYSAEGSALGCGELRHRAVSHLAGCLVRVALARATLPFAAALWSPPGPVGASCVGTAGPGRRGPPVFVQLGELRGTAFGVCDKPGKSRVPGVVTGTPLGQAPRPQHCCGRRGARPLSPCSGPSSS